MAGGETTQHNKDNMKLNQLILATVAGMQLVFPAWAADDTATNSTGAARAEIPAYTAGGGTTQSVEAAEIEGDLRAAFYIEGDVIFTVDIGSHVIYRV